jgi:uncharacterized membrane protein
MRAAFVALFGVVTLLNVGLFFVLPDRVAIHFGTEGEPDDWAPRLANLLISQLTATVLFVLLMAASRLVEALPRRWVNLPNRDYWMGSERWSTARKRLARRFAELGIYLLLLFAAIGTLAALANLRRPVRLDETAFLVCLGAFFVAVAVWLVRFYRAFRKPGNESDSAADQGALTS